MAGGQNFFQDRPQLYFAQNTAGLYAGKHLLQAAHIGGKVLHLAQALVHLFQLGADRPERFADPALQRGFQLFVHRAADFIQLFVIVGPDVCHALQQGCPHAVQPVGVGVFQIFQAGFQHLQLSQQGIVGSALAGGTGAVDGVQPGGGGLLALALAFGQQGSHVPRTGGGCAGHFALHHAQLVGQHFGFGLYFIPHNAGNFIGLVLGGVLLAAAQQKQNQQHIGQYRQQQKNNQ